MKLSHRVFYRLSAGVSLILLGWAVCFYFAIIEEINDEVDDSLEDYSEVIITRSLAGAELPSKDSGSNNQYFLTQVTDDYAAARPTISYCDSMVYIPEKRETEPARILTTLFRDAEGRYHQLIVSTPTIEKADLRESILQLIIFLYIALLLTLMLINLWVFRKSMKPLYTLLHWIDSYRLGSRNDALDNPTDISEFRKLNEASLRNAHRSEEMFEEQKQFIGNASHELQTPLAICQNRIEMLLEDESLSEAQLEELLKTYRTLEHASKLNKALLLLSKIDNHQFTDTEEVNLNRIARQFAEDYEAAYSYRNVSLAIDENGIFLASMPPTLATILITNLMKNAYVHNVEGGHIRIGFSERQITFRNTAASGALDETRIFERFYQGSKKEGSTGLGLAIVHSICKQYGLEISYQYKEKEHIFRIRNLI